MSTCSGECFWLMGTELDEVIWGSIIILIIKFLYRLSSFTNFLSDFDCINLLYYQRPIFDCLNTLQG